jgi:uncharacterized protein YfbU (UPF0304 family)
MRMDEEMLERIDAWRREQGGVPSRSEAVRRLVDRGLGQHSGKSVVLSDGEKLVTLLLLEIYKHLKVDGGFNADMIAGALYDGHSWALRWQMSGLFHGHEDSPENVSTTVAVLDMWRYIEGSFKRLPAKERARLSGELKPLGLDARFTGFDGNEESEYFGIARFLVEEMGRFAEFKGRELNSHFPTLPAYEQMLDAFERMRDGLHGADLTTEQILTILKAPLQRGK